MNGVCMRFDINFCVICVFFIFLKLLLKTSEIYLNHQLNFMYVDYRFKLATLFLVEE